MLPEKNKGGRPPTVWQMLVRRDPEIRQLAGKGYTRIESSKIMSVSRNKMGEYWSLNGIERNTDIVNYTESNSTPENLAVLESLDKEFRAGMYRRYRLFNDTEIDNGPRRKRRPRALPNRMGIHENDISSQINLAKLEALRTFNPRHGSGAAFRTYAYKVLFNAMRQFERDAVKEARKRNQGGVDSSDDEQISMGIEDTIVMDEDGEIVRIESCQVKASFAEAQKQAQLEASYSFVWDPVKKEYHKSPRLKDRRVLFCLHCHTYYVPRWLGKPLRWVGQRVVCPACFKADSIDTKMTEHIMSLDGISQKEHRNRRDWMRFLGNTYNRVDRSSSTPQTIPLTVEEHHDGNSQEVRS